MEPHGLAAMVMLLCSLNVALMLGLVILVRGVRRALRCFEATASVAADFKVFKVVTTAVLKAKYDAEHEESGNRSERVILEKAAAHAADVISNSGINVRRYDVAGMCCAAWQGLRQKEE